SIPEKDQKQIAAALKSKTGYPACMLCPANVGYAGNAGHPARQTLRTIPVTLNDEQWWIQYSPYQYYSKHLIAFCDEHRPMKVNHDCIARLVDFVDQFPHFFMGSNAALPIVGGSILTHDHYQGGGKGLPMFKAPVRKTFKSPIKGAEISIIDWYNSVVRVSSKKKLTAVECADYVLRQWADYTDESVNIICKTDAQHNAVTPIARFENGKYIVDMILRNNRTDDAHPYGIYHPTEDLHNIKKEGIGIIEVMGTFILPGRLDKELKAIEKYLTGEDKFDYAEVSKETHPLTKHKDMIKSLIEANGTNNSLADSEKIVKNYINQTCEKILEFTSVFKNNEQGRNAFDKFMTEGLGCK
ncbi:MAG: galactose-1-phosphate uridylyltransferase, partial [Clostridia bacterium]|nr:galactose-1-phosphate uridylyltransferase [Clostridia bacterium]